MAGAGVGAEVAGGDEQLGAQDGPETRQRAPIVDAGGEPVACPEQSGRASVRQVSVIAVSPGKMSHLVDRLLGDLLRHTAASHRRSARSAAVDASNSMRSVTHKTHVPDLRHRTAPRHGGRTAAAAPTCRIAHSGINFALASDSFRRTLEPKVGIRTVRAAVRRTLTSGDHLTCNGFQVRFGLEPARPRDPCFDASLQLGVILQLSMGWSEASMLSPQPEQLDWPAP